MSWKPEVIADPSGKWSGNALRFATEEEAKGYVADLYARWTLVRETRVVECEDPVTATWPVDQPAREPRPRARSDQGLSAEIIEPGDFGRVINDLTRKVEHERALAVIAEGILEATDDQIMRVAKERGVDVTALERKVRAMVARRGEG